MASVHQIMYLIWIIFVQSTSSSALIILCNELAQLHPIMGLIIILCNPITKVHPIMGLIII